MFNITFYCDATVVDYHDKNEEVECIQVTAPDILIEAGITGGKMYFKFDENRGVLIGFTTYKLAKKLTLHQQKLLKEYTITQWSDGIGAHFSQARISVGLVPQILVYSGLSVSVRL